MAPRVSIVCTNPRDDRVLPRFARYLRDQLGWHLGAAPDPAAEVIYLSGYFEANRLKPWPDKPVASYFTHREEEPPGNAKAKLFDQVAEKAQLRVAMCRLYGEPLSAYGPTVTPPLPVERDRFTVPAARKARKRPTVGLSGYTYANHRKGEDIIRGMLDSKVSKRVEWRASGRGWPIPTKRYDWDQMPSYYQALDVLVCPSRVEGGPMPVLEALSCGASVVIPRGVGILDEIPDTPGIYRYDRGDLAGLLAALDAAAFPSEKPEPEALREATAPYSVDAFVEAHRTAFAEAFGVGDAAGIEQAEIPAVEVKAIKHRKPVNRHTNSTRGIYCVAFGTPARTSALRLMESAKRHMPDIPIALCASSPIGPEDVLIKQADSDVGGRRAKLRAYELAPAEWQAVLYLDADTEVTAPIYPFWQWIESGWEFVICKDPHLMDEMTSFERKNNRQEMRQIEETIKTLHALQINGGVWAFGRSDRIAAFFARWLAEWERHAQRDQGALLRAMYADPLRVMWLGNQWNTFPKYEKGIISAGLYHYPGDARRWRGMIPGRIDSPEAWAMVKRFEAGKR